MRRCRTRRKIATPPGLEGSREVLQAKQAALGARSHPRAVAQRRMPMAFFLTSERRVSVPRAVPPQSRIHRLPSNLDHRTEACARANRVGTASAASMKRKHGCRGVSLRMCSTRTERLDHHRPQSPGLHDLNNRTEAHRKSLFPDHQMTLLGPAKKPREPWSDTAVERASSTAANLVPTSRLSLLAGAMPSTLHGARVATARLRCQGLDMDTETSPRYGARLHAQAGPRRYRT